MAEIKLEDIQPGDTVAWLTTGFGETVKHTGIVRSVGETHPGSGEMRVYVKRTGKNARTYAGTVTGLDPARICEHTPGRKP